jgi:cytochrome P450
MYQSRRPTASLGLLLVVALSSRFLEVFPLGSITDASGDEWKQQRKIFNPSFSPKKLIETSLKKMCDQALVFVEILQNLAVTGETFPLHQYVKVRELFSAITY